jgi:Holliday junction resolvase RusA-like endonuclease
MLIPSAWRNTNLSAPCNVKCVYFMPDRRRVDLLNLLSATLDVLVKSKVLKDDHSGIVRGHDGSTVLIDKENPRTEIEIDLMEGT